MRFQVPQFINIEDKLFGPLTIKQFVYLVGGGGMCYIAWNFLPFFIAIFIIGPVAMFALLLAFAKPNGKPFIFLLQAAIQYLIGTRLYLWKRVSKKMKPRDAAGEFAPDASVPSLSESKLKDLTWALDINQNVKKQHPN